MKMTILLFVITLLLISTHSIADIYRWVDKDTGEIFFAETPPPPEVTQAYENITQAVKKREQQRQQRAQANIANPGITQTGNQQTTTTDKQKTAQNGVISDRVLLIQRRCKNFNEQITRLETHVSQTTDPDVMDQLIIKLAEYEASFAVHCQNSLVESPVK